MSNRRPLLVPRLLAMEGEWECYTHSSRAPSLTDEDFLSFRGDFDHSSGVQWKLYWDLMRASFVIIPRSRCCGAKFTLIPTVYCSKCVRPVQRSLVRNVLTTKVVLFKGVLNGDDWDQLQHWCLILHGDELSATLAALDLKSLAETAVAKLSPS